MRDLSLIHNATQRGISMDLQAEAINFIKGMPFSDGYVAGNTLYVAGQQGLAPSGRSIVTDIGQQTTNAINAVKKVVEDAAFRMSDIVSVTVYFTDLTDVPAINAVYMSLLQDPKPARVAVQVAGLIGGAKVEISATAVKR
jgi:2-iminobutanoate/2-iminopropanoate deaminase